MEEELKSNPRMEPLVLCHSDLQGRNFMMQGTNIAAIIDLEFAGSFPLSELVDGGIEVLEMGDEESVKECFEWCDKICKLIDEIAKERNWQATDVELLMSDGDPVVQSAKVEMVPEYSGGSEPDDASDQEVGVQSGGSRIVSLICHYCNMS